MKEETKVHEQGRGNAVAQAFLTVATYLGIDKDYTIVAEMTVEHINGWLWHELLR